MVIASGPDTRRSQPARRRRGQGGVNARDDAPTPGWPPAYLTARAGASRADGDTGAIPFIQAACRITKDSLGGQVGDTLRLREWQKLLLRGLLSETSGGGLAHRTAYIGLPRKNGKSALLSSLALWALIFGPDGGEVYSVAGEKDQARITFGTGRRMVELEPGLSGVVKLYRDAIEMPSTGSVWRVVSSDAPLKEGLSPTFTLVDEVHVIDRDLWDVFALAQGARREPMLVGITTAGARVDSHGQDTLAYQLYQHGRRVASGETIDPSFYFAWWGAGEHDDHREPETWRKANPGYDDLVGAEDFASAVLRVPEAEYRTKRLNQWVLSVSSWLPTGAWDACRDGIAIENGERVVLGFDGSFTNDSTALVACTADGRVGVVGCWERPLDDQHWRVDMDAVAEAVEAACERYSVAEIAVDPAGWSREHLRWQERGLPVVAFPQTPMRMVTACAAFYTAVVQQRIRHDGDPRLSRHLDNAVVKVDQAGPRIVKETRSSLRKIDLAVAAVMAYDRARSLAERPAAGPNIFVW